MLSIALQAAFNERELLLVDIEMLKENRDFDELTPLLDAQYEIRLTLLEQQLDNLDMVISQRLQMRSINAVLYDIFNSDSSCEEV